MIFLKTGAWVLVADGRKALFLRNSGDTREYDLRVVWHRTMDNPATREQGADRPGRPPSGPGGQGSAMQATDWHQIAEDRFAAEVADILDKAHADNAFEEIVIVAPPKVLGELRDHLSAPTLGSAIAEVAKTLTDHPLDRIARILKSDLDEG